MNNDLVAAEQAFVNAAQKLFVNRADVRTPNVLHRIIPNNVALSLVAPDPSSFSLGGSVNLSITPDCNATRDTVYNELHADGYYGKVLRELAKIYEPRNLTMYLNFVADMDPEIMYQFYGDSYLYLKLVDDMDINLARLSKQTQLNIEALNNYVPIDDIREWLEYQSTIDLVDFTQTRRLLIESDYTFADYLDQRMKRIVRSSIDITLGNRDPNLSMYVQFMVFISDATKTWIVEYLQNLDGKNYTTVTTTNHPRNIDDVGIVVTTRNNSNVPNRELRFDFGLGGCFFVIDITSHPGEFFHLHANPGRNHEVGNAGSLSRGA